MKTLSSRVIYIIGPYTHPDPVENVRRAVLYADKLRRQGHVPIVPHLSHLWHLICPHAYGFWLDLSVDTMEAVMPDEVHRLPGESKGADIEEKKAVLLGFKMVYVDFGT